MTTAEDVINRHAELKNERAIFEPLWHMVAERMDPYGAVMGGKLGDQSKIFGSKPLLLPDTFASVFTSLLMPRGSIWHGLAPLDEGLRERRDVKEWASKMTDILFRHRYAPASGFSGLPRRMGRALALYGSQAILVKEELGADPSGKPYPPIRYKFIPINQICIARNRRGEYDAFSWEDQKTARQLAQEYDESVLPAKVKDALDKSDGNAEQKFTVINLVQPATGKSAHAWESWHVLQDERSLLRSHGYHNFPLMASVFNEIDDHAYGWGPALLSLPDVKQYFAMNRTTVGAMERVVAPPMGIAGKLDKRINLNAGQFVPNMVTEDGKPKFAPMSSGAQPERAFELIAAKGEEIDRSFYVHVWQILTNKPDMTAYEVAQRAQEKADLIGPPFAPQEEALGRMVQRELAILERQAEFGEIQLPPRPRALEGQEITLEFTSPLARIRRSGETASIYKTIEAVNAIAPMDPTVAQIIDWKKAIRKIADNEGVPEELLVPAAQIAQMEQAQAEAEEQGQAVAMQAQAAENANKVAPFLKAISETQRAS